MLSTYRSCEVRSIIDHKITYIVIAKGDGAGITGC